VEIIYQDLSDNIVSVTYLLTGTTPVVVAEKMKFIYGMEAVTGGTSEVGVGNIDLRIAGAGAIHERITAGGNRSMTGRFKVPAGYTGYISNWGVTTIGNTQDARLRATVQTFDGVVVSRYIFQTNAFVSAGQSYDAALPYLKMPAGSLIKTSTLPGATGAGVRVDTHFTIFLVQN
jgi:hypothetical protein